MLGSFAASFRLSDFPRTRATLLLLIPALLALAGTVDTLRCLQPRWNFYHAGIILLLFMDMLAICLILFFLPLLFIVSIADLDSLYAVSTPSIRYTSPCYSNIPLKDFSRLHSAR